MRIDSAAVRRRAPVGDRSARSRRLDRVARMMWAAEVRGYGHASASFRSTRRRCSAIRCRTSPETDRSASRADARSWSMVFCCNRMVTGRESGFGVFVSPLMYA